MPFCFPLADRAELLFGDQERDHVFPVVGFALQTLTIRLGLGVTHLAAHIVFGLNLGHSGEPTTGLARSALTASATFVHHEYLCSHEVVARQRHSRHAFQCRCSMSYAPRGQSVQIVDRTGAP